jgi:hypothetical protein
MKTLLALLAASMLTAAVAAPADAAVYVYRGHHYHYRYHGHYYRYYHVGRYYNVRHCYWRHGHRVCTYR